MGKRTKICGGQSNILRGVRYLYVETSDCHSGIRPERGCKGRLNIIQCLIIRPRIVGQRGIFARYLHDPSVLPQLDIALLDLRAASGGLAA